MTPPHWTNGLEPLYGRVQAIVGRDPVRRMGDSPRYLVADITVVGPGWTLEARVDAAIADEVRVGQIVCAFAGRDDTIVLTAEAPAEDVAEARP